MKRRMIFTVLISIGFLLLATFVFLPQQMSKAQCIAAACPPTQPPSNNGSGKKSNYRNPTPIPTWTPTPTALPVPVIHPMYPPPYLPPPNPYLHGPYPTVPHPPLCAVPCWLIPPQPWEEVELGGLIIVVFGAGFFLFRKMSGPGGGD